MKSFPKICKNYTPDEGYYFGLGVFETMLYKNGEIQLLDLHMKRITESAAVLGIIPSDGLPANFYELQSHSDKLPACSDKLYAYSDKIRLELAAYLKETGNIPDNTVVKLAWSGERLFCSVRPNTYTKEVYERGFDLKISPILRNETSLFTYHKTLNYGDNILEKRRAYREGFDEPVFLNSRGEITEGATTNIFYVTEEGIFTPPVESGLLNGTVRQHLLRSDLCIKERPFFPDEIRDVKEIFVTNALLGIMPVRSLEGKEFCDFEAATRIRQLLGSEHA